jgi:hypothetical protein
MREIAAYAILRDGTSVGFDTVDEALAWREDHKDWREFGWSEKAFQEWRKARGWDKEPRCKPADDLMPGRIYAAKEAWGG